MYEIHYNEPIHVHFIGIGGISMSGLAEILLSKGFTVSGSDSRKSELTRTLEDQGATIFYGQRASNIKEETDLVVYTAAIHPDNPEYEEAVNRGIPMIPRAALLGQIMKNYKIAVAVSGTHGKTTTTSMVSELLVENNFDPTFTVGGILKSSGTNMRIGQSDCFVTEACEYTNSFLSFFPTIGIILNIEEDHLDFFKDLADIRNSFRKFASLLPKDGLLIINGDIENYQEIIADAVCKVITFGMTAHNDYHPASIHYGETGCAVYTPTAFGQNGAEITLMVPGEHNILNSLSALALSDALSVPREAAIHTLGTFSGAQRRFEKKGCIGGITIVDDYAHHPTEITATLKAAHNYPHERIWCVFQPHTYTRTAAFLHEFAEALSNTDYVILTDIYAAREQNTIGISSKDLQAEIEKLGKTCYYFSTFDEIENCLLQNCTKGDLLITMGAGDVVKIGENLLGI